VADDSRIADLERRVDNDPASIAFAQLAEEYRRAGRFDDAVRVCRAGLERHPAYPSAQLTLGRALLAQGHLDEALKELLAVASEAPDNVAAIRALEQLKELLPPDDHRPVLQELEQWLEAIRADRAGRQSGAMDAPAVEVQPPGTGRHD
jgi:tetratricopeptide (TPR) repeat protein